MKYDMYKIGKRIANERKKAGFKNAEQFCAYLDAKKDYPISRKTLSSIENGHFTTQNLNVKFLLILCDVFNCDMGYLLCEYDERTRDKHDIYSSIGLSEKSSDYLKENKNKSLLYEQSPFCEDNEAETLSESYGYALNYIIENYPDLIKYIGKILLHEELDLVSDYFGSRKSCARSDYKPQKQETPIIIFREEQECMDIALCLYNICRQSEKKQLSYFMPYSMEERFHFALSIVEDSFRKIKSIQTAQISNDDSE